MSALVDSRVVQQQDDGVELFPGPVISPQGHDEVVEAVAGGLSRHDDELVLEAVGLGVLEAVVSAALEEERRQRVRRWPRTEPAGEEQECPPGRGAGSRTGPSQPADGTGLASSQCTESSGGNLSRSCKLMST